MVDGREGIGNLEFEKTKFFFTFLKYTIFFPIVSHPHRRVSKTSYEENSK